MAVTTHTLLIRAFYYWEERYGDWRSG